jgi:hypothetical protein
MTAFVAIAAFMIGGPVAEQVFGLRTALIRSWIMFSAPGIGMIDVTFTMRQPDGTSVSLDRFALLNEPPDGPLKRIETRKELAEVIGRLCAAAGPGADIHVVARQAIRKRKGWRRLHDGTENVCGA